MSDPKERTVPIMLKDLSLPSNRSMIPCLQIITGDSAGRVVPLTLPETFVGRDPASELQLDETGISRRHACIRVVPGNIVSVEDLDSTNGTYLDEQKVTKSPLTKGNTLSFGGVVMAKFDLRSREELELAEALYATSLRDPLTKALKREAFLEFLDQQHAMLTRRPSRFCLFLVEVDRFAQLEGSSVREVGDALLKQLADILRKATRLGDVLGRYGHENFAIYLHGIEKDQGQQVAERICRQTAESVFEIVRGERTLKFSLTVSVGGAEWAAPTTVEALCASAELGLAQAQKAGGNTHEIAFVTPN